MPATSVSRTIAAPRDQVWSVLSDIGNARRWNSAWSTVEFATNQTHGPGTRFRAETGNGDRFEFEVSAWVAPEYIEFSPVRDEAEQYGILLEAQGFHLVPDGEGATRVELTARASTHGLKGRLLGLLFWRGYQKQGLNYALETLASLFEPEEGKEREDEEASAGDTTPAAD
jgi:uncharacterized protein YndB with AHSA1/START domain